MVSSLFGKPQGYFVSTDPDPRKSIGQTAVTEMASITCGHCGTLVLVDLSAAEPPTELCYGCRRNICLKCVAERRQTMKCDVIENKLERIEASARFARAIGLGK